MKYAREQLKDLLRGYDQVLSKPELEMKLERGQPLRIKLGVDPSSPDIHLGHTVVLRKLRQFQDLGHQAILIIGDFTALVGDPTGKKKTRPQLTPAEVEANAATYIAQVGRVLNMEKVEIVRNSAWLKTIPFYEFIKLASKLTVAQMLERDDFSKRMKAEEPVYLHEVLYLVMQAYDSVMVGADVELGGSDQLFNLMVGRDLMKSVGQEPQVAFTMPLLVGLGSSEKMSKSLQNHIGVLEDPLEMYSKVMSLPDDTMREWYNLLTTLSPDEIERLLTKVHPKMAKDRLAREIVNSFNPGKADEAASEWERKFTKREVVDAEELSTPAQTGIVDLVMRTKIPPSKGEAKRLIDQGSVELDGKKQTDITAMLSVESGMFLKVGKKKSYFKLLVK